MKKLITLFVIIALNISVYAQLPQKMSYQAVIRNNSGVLVANQSIGMKISVLLGTASGTIIYQEIYNPNPQTNINGLVTIEIGGGIPLTGTFSSINWSNGSYFLKTETDPTGGTNYTIVGTSQLLSVPYAMYAKTAGNGFSGNYNDLSNKPSLAIVATSGNYNDLTNKPTLFNGSWVAITSKPTTLAGYEITDGMNTSHVVNGITSTMIGNWNNAFGWGNHSGLYRPISYIPAWNEITGKPAFATVATSGNFTDLLSKPTTLAGYGITNAMNTSHVSNGITSTNISNWSSAYNWGNHASAGYAIFPSQISNSGKFLTTNGTSVSWGSLATVANTGSYNDLTNKPTLPNLPAGSNSGDILYWNGATWTIVPVGSPGQFLQLSQSNIPTWIGAKFCTVSTTNIASITSGSVIISGNVANDGGSTVTTRGICYGTLSTPTLANNFVTSGTGTGDFIANINGLTSNTTYYVRSFAANSAGTSYGNILSFKTLASGGYTTITDVMGNIYNIVTIGTQEWLKENLKTTKFNDGTPITQVTDFVTWRNLSTPGFCWYNNDSTAYHNLYGPLYNGYVITTNKLCPIGWHVPSDIEWSTLEKYLGMDSIQADNYYGWRGTDQGNKLRSTIGWQDAGATNSSGFTALPGGYRDPTMYSYGAFVYEGSNAYIWGSTESSSTNLWYRQLAGFGQVGRAEHSKNEGMSVRCIKD